MDGRHHSSFCTTKRVRSEVLSATANGFNEMFDEQVDMEHIPMFRGCHDDVPFIYLGAALGPFTHTYAPQAIFNRHI